MQQTQSVSVVTALGGKSNAQCVDDIATLEPPFRPRLDVRADPPHRVFGHGSRADRERRQCLASPRAELHVRLTGARRDRDDLLVKRTRAQSSRSRASCAMLYSVLSRCGSFDDSVNRSSASS